MDFNLVNMADIIAQVFAAKGVSMQTLIMSMSGTRGIVGEALTPQVALQTAIAFGRFVGKGPVIIGGDTRTSFDMIKCAVVSGLLSIGIDVIDIGRVPTPTVQQAIRRYGASGGIVVTASHNPVIWNGLKLMNKDASFLTASEYAAYSQYFGDPKAVSFANWEKVGQYTADPTAITCHVAHILDRIDVTPIRHAKLRVLVDPNNGAGCVADPTLLDQLGVKYTLLNAEPSGRFAHDPEPLEKNLAAIKAEMATGNYDIGFVQDADADRLVILDETGRFIGEDYSLGLCIDHILALENQPNPTVVVNLSTSQVIEDITQRYGGQVIYTKIGESNVTEGIRTHKAVVGGEGNGGVIYPKIGWGRDSLVGIVVALRYLATSRKKVSEIVSAYPRYVMSREKIAVKTPKEVHELVKKVAEAYPHLPQNTEDGVKISLSNGWVQVRGSNTEPIIRIFVEGPSESECLKIQSEIRLLL
jgi:phosphomannomutase